MIWQDLMLDRWVDGSALRDAAALAFEVPITAVAVVDDVEQLPSLLPSSLVVLERTRQHRDFPLQVMVVLRDEALARRFSGFEGVRSVGQALAATLGVAVLFAEGPLSASEWVRARPTGELDVVSLDSDETGNVDSFFVIAERAFTGDSRAADSGPARVIA